MSALHYDSYTDARTHLKDLLDAAGRGRLATVRRDASTVVVLDAERLRLLLATNVPPAQVVPEAGGWSVFLPGLPVAADAASFDEAIDEFVDALREYAADWQDRLLDVANHRDNWAVVALVGLSDDDQLRRWLVG
ncbi:MAG: prevent-host-death protein [Pseudonocardia sp.]|nr:prevent-host-death protein [Pseudonocardia sp.]